MTLQERLTKYLCAKAQIDESAYVSPNAVVIGDVKIGANASVWPCVVLRADINSIEIGEGSNVQDGTMVHLADEYGVKIGKLVTIGHGAIIHACEIDDETLIGMGATILDGAKIGKQCIVGANALVTGKTVIPDGSLVLGSPAKVVKQLTPEVRAKIKNWAIKYMEVAAFHKSLNK